jgi:hypothetical protein
LRHDGFAVAEADSVARLAGATLPQLSALAPEWNDMPIDPYLKDGGHYRHRRHASFMLRDGDLTCVAYRPHFQPTAYNALHGGMVRWFAPMRAALTGAPLWRGLVCGAAAICSALDGPGPWHVEAHQFRIDTSEGIGRPTPEGAHRDGVDFVALFLIARESIRGGESRVFAADTPHGLRFTLSEPWSMLLLDDRRVIHETTPLQPLRRDACAAGHRDTLVLTFRRAGFQEP